MPERLLELLIEIETEAAAFYEALAQRATDPLELHELWVSLAEEERQHASWVRRLRGSLRAEGVLASLPAPSVARLEIALSEIRWHRQRLDHGAGSSTDALAAAIALETSEASRALADLVAAAPDDRDPGPYLPFAGAHLGRLARAAERLGIPELAATVRDLAPRLEPALAGRRTVLIVDDDPDMVETCARILRSTGHDCLTATGGRQAIDLIRSHRVDLILADLRMPEMDGLALLASARGVAPEVPVIIFSAYGSADTARQVREAGAAGYLAKPFGVSELRDVVTRALVRPRGSEGLASPPHDPGR